MKAPFCFFLFTLLVAFSFRVTSSQSHDFRIIKERVVQELMKPPVDDTRIKTIIGRMNDDGSFQGIDYSDLSRTAGFPHRNHTSNLVSLARAYKNKSSGFYQNKKAKETIVKGLTFWVKNDYIGDNWHDNQITTPSSLGNLMLLIGDELPADLVAKAQPIIGRANMNASGARPSGDRIVIAGILAKNLLFNNNHEEFDKVIKIIEGELKFNTGQRGMQHDYSFHHRVDRVNNTTSYGYGKYANAFGEWAWYVAGTSYAFSIDKINQLVDYYLDGICKQLVYGIYEDVSAKNRSISGKSDFEPQGITEIDRLLAVTNYRKNELEEIKKLRKGEAKPSLSFCKFFWQTEHFVIQRPTFYTTVRMFSTRNRNMEEPYNGPGILTHHRADGTNYLQLKGDEYLNIWPVYNWQKISGTTILQKPQMPGQDKIQMDGLTDFVGAVTDGMYGAVAFDFISPHDKTEAKKSWFFFDNEYICLGTAINSKSDLPVYTTIDQALLKNDVTIREDGKAKILPVGNRELNKVKWVHHNKVGYILPQPATINLSNQEEQGRWSDITAQKNISKEIVKLDVFMLWFNHGPHPSNAFYEYIVVPDVTVKELEETAENNRGIRILSNTSSIQAVTSDKTGIVQAVFYSPGEVEFIKGLKMKMENQGIAMLKLEGNKVRKLAVSDPSRKLETLTVTIPGVYQVKGNNFEAISSSVQNSTTFRIKLPQGVYAGKSEVIDL